MTFWRESRSSGGGILIMTLVFVVMFATMFIALTSLTGRQFREGVLQAHDELAFQIAEAGLNYGRWRLAHNDQDFATETKDVDDPLGDVVGSYEVTFTPPDPGSTIVLVESTGWTASTPTREVTLRARHGIPSLAQYVSVTNDDVWYSGELHGPVHSNGGIRMDGTSDSLMTSAKETYTCKSIHGCSNEEKPGVWGDGEKQELWEFPVPAVDYNSITVDLLDMKEAATSAGTYWGDSGGFGYHVVFDDSNTYTLYRVTSKTPPIWSHFKETGWEFTSHDVATQEFVSSDDVPSNGVLFFEDTVWIEGDIRDRVTVAAGVFPEQPETYADIIVDGNISYGGVHDGSRVLGAVAQRHVLLPYSGIPDDLTLDGAFVAQKGRFGRRYYYYGPHQVKGELTRYGMIASNLAPVTAWVDEGVVTSGFTGGSSVYDPNLLYGPPPYFPTVGQYEFLSWEQIK